MTRTIEDIVAHCRDLLELMPAQAVEQARQRHPHVEGFGVFPVYAPLEVIHAAGLMPVGLFGAGGKVELSHAESRFQSFICSIAKSTLELFLRGDMDAFAGVVFSSICDVARNLASVVKRNAPKLYVEYLHLPQNLYSTGSAAYTRAEFERFRTNLARHLGRPVPDQAIQQSLTLYNRVRAATRALYEHRRRYPGAIAAAELFALVQAGTRMMPEDYAPMLDDVLQQVSFRKFKGRDGARVVIEGSFCEQPPLGLIETIEAAGCIIKDDDLVIGWRLFPSDVEVSRDPLGSLARAYLSSNVYTSVRHDRERPRTDGLMRRMAEAGGEAVVFAPAKFCEPALLDYVPFRLRLEEARVPHLKVEFEEKMWSFESVRTEVETFAESMLFD